MITKKAFVIISTIMCGTKCVLSRGLNCLDSLKACEEHICYGDALDSNKVLH